MGKVVRFLKVPSSVPKSAKGLQDYLINMAINAGMAAIYSVIENNPLKFNKIKPYLVSLAHTILEAAGEE